MLADRPYMRGGSMEGHRSAALLLVIINVAIYLLESVLYGFGLEMGVRRFLALSTGGIESGQLWQLFTFQFLHALPWPWHLLFNCLALYFFGREVEHALGRKTFLKLYLIAGVLGGVLQLISFWVTGKAEANYVVGASAGVFGLVAAYATLFPERQITLLLFFFIPVTLKAKYLFWAALVLSIFGATQADSNMAHAAHLGGLLAGVGYIRWGLQAESWWQARRVRRPRTRQRELVRVISSRSWQQSKKGPEELPPEEFISREVDPILEKISAHGIHSLTPRERQILEAARSRMGKR